MRRGSGVDESQALPVQLSHGYIQHNFAVQEWAAPEFLEKAASELLEEEWQKRSIAKLPQPVSLDDAMTLRLG